MAQDKVTKHAITITCLAKSLTNGVQPFSCSSEHLQLPIEKVLSSEPSPNSGELEDLVTILRERHADAITQVIDNQKDARKRQREWYNRRAREKGFEIGDLVYVYTPSVKPGNAKKLTAKWLSGFVIEGKHSNGLTYDVRKPGSHKPPEKVHVNRLKPCPQSHVYRTAGKAGRVLGTGRTMQASEAMHRELRAQQGDEGDTDGESSSGDDYFPGLNRYLQHPGAAAKAGESSGITTVLEAVTDVHRSDDSSVPAGAESQVESTDTDLSGEEIPEPQREGRPRRVMPLYERIRPQNQRPQRNRKPPDRYSP